MNKPESEATSGRSVTTLVARHIESSVQYKEINTFFNFGIVLCYFFGPSTLQFNDNTFSSSHAQQWRMKTWENGK